jgi:hypothetical protein
MTFVIARSVATKQSILRLALDCFASLAMTVRGTQCKLVSASQAGYPGALPNVQQYRRGYRTNGPACPMADASPHIGQAAIPSPAGSAARQNRRRSSGTHCAACSRRSPRRTCIRKSRCALPRNAAADPCRNIRNSAGVATPWWSHQVGARRIIANQLSGANAESPSISAISHKFTAATPSTAALSFPSNDPAQSRSAHAPRSGAAAARC